MKYQALQEQTHSEEISTTIGVTKLKQKIYNQLDIKFTERQLWTDLIN